MPKAEPSPTCRAAVGELAGILLALHRHFLSRLSRPLERGRVSFAQFSFLGYLDQFGPLPVGEIARLMGHSVAAASGMADRLEALQYARRRRDHRDRRRVMVEITRRGNCLVGGVRLEVDKNLRALMRDLGPDDCAAWLRVYRKIHRHYKLP